MIIQSCENCWFNGLQYGSLGLSVGYCTLHNKILSASHAITCASHQRKDLTLMRVQQVSEQHNKFYPSPEIIRLADKQPAVREVSGSEKDLEYLCKDKVGELVADYGALNTTIESFYAVGDPLASAQGIIDKAALSVPDFNIRKLLKWLEREAGPSLDKYMDRKRYAELAKQLRVDKPS